MQPQTQPQPDLPPAPQPAPAPGAYAPQPQGPAAAPAADNAAVGQFPVDYLNQISGGNQVKKAKPALVFGLIGGVLLLVAGALFFLIQSAAPPNVGSQVYALQARIETLSAITEEQGKYLTQSELSTINSTLNASLTSMKTGLTTYAKGLTSSTKGTSAAKTAESTYYKALSKKLEDAYLVGTLDRTYTTELQYELSILKSMMQRIKTTAKSSTYNSFYSNNTTSIDTVTGLLSSFQSTK